MKTCRKEDFVHFVLDQLVGATHNLERKVAMKDNKEGGDHDVRDDWARFPLSVIDHGFASMRRYVRKSSSMTLNEALCGRQPDLYFIYINMTVYIALFNRNIK